MFTDSRENPCSWRWNPPRHQEFAAELSFVPDDVQSATECTGLMQTVPDTQGAADAMAGLLSILPVKPQGNPGKDNPNNDPSEILFHRK